MGLLSLARGPAVIVTRVTAVHEALRLMGKHGVGAVAVVGTDQLCGIFTERDFLARVALPGLDAKTTAVGDVMTAPVKALSTDTSCGDALRLMVEHDFCYAPVTDDRGRVLAMLSIRDLLELRVDELSRELDSVVSFFAVDGIGG